MIAPSRIGPRSELKFPIDAGRAAELFAWSRGRLDPDPHARDPELASYLVESVYFDTPRLDCFRRRGVDGLPKYRARRYDGVDREIFLEEKLRRENRVWKRRLGCGLGELGELTEGRATLAGDREWFRSRFRVLLLEPALLVRYSRRALVGENGLRVTLDQGISCRRLDGEGLDFESTRPATRLCGDEEILEIKFGGNRGALVDEILAMAGVEPSSCSKYGMGVVASGLASARSEKA